MDKKRPTTSVGDPYLDLLLAVCVQAKREHQGRWYLAPEEEIEERWRRHMAVVEKASKMGTGGNNGTASERKQ